MPRDKGQKVWCYLDKEKNPKRALSIDQVLLGIQQKHDPQARRLRIAELPDETRVVTTFRWQAMSDPKEQQWETIVTYPEGGPTHKRRFNGSAEVALAEHQAMVTMAQTLQK